MLSPVLIAVALLLAGGAVLLLAYRFDRRDQTEVERRIGLAVTLDGPERTSAASDEQTKRDRNQLDIRVRNFFAFGFSRTWGMQSGMAKLMLAAAISAGVTFLAVRLPLGTGPGALLAALAAFFVGPRLLLMREQRKADRQLVDLLPDAVDTAVRMLRAGLPITSSLRFIGNTAPAPVNTVFTMVADQTEIGMPVEEALDAGSQQIGLADFRFFAIAIVLQRATGGNLASTLEILSDIMRKRRAMRLKAKAATAEVRISAYVLGALPLICVGGMLLIQPAYFLPLLQDPRGRVIIGAAAGSLLAALLTMHLMTRRVSAG
jgi:tight adherence protein B